MSRPRFHVPDLTLAATHVVLPDDEAHHARRVLRLTDGAAVGVFDGAGREWSGVLASGPRDALSVERLERRDAVPEPPVRLTLAIAVLKGEQMDTVVRDATVLGVTTIVPLLTARTVVPRAARAAAHDRWRRVAIAAAKQCGRSVVPTIEPVGEIVRAWPTGETRAIFAVEPSREPSSGLPPMLDDRPGAACLFVGPEGGWSDDELQQARDHGAQALSLGPRTLRAETVPIVALTALWTRWGWN